MTDRRAYQREWARAKRSRDPEPSRAGARRYRLRHPDRIAASTRERNAPRHDEMLARLKAWKDAHPERVRAARRATRQRNADSIQVSRRRWLERNREKRNIVQKLYQARRRAATRERVTVGEWLAILDAWQHRCAYCWSAATNLVADHVIPLARGGRHLARNIVPSCVRCNSSKHTRSVVAFLWARCADAA